MSDIFFNIEETSSVCVECGKKIKSSHYYAGRGPYGICCYKKLFGFVGLIITRPKSLNISSKKIKNKEDIICSITGENKNCNQCLFSEDCEYKDGRK